MAKTITDKKRLILEYKEKKALGAVYGLKNTQTGKTLLLSTPNLGGAYNRFTFSKKNSSCIHPKLTQEWENPGPEFFIMEVYEELAKNPNQTQKDFLEDLKVLEDMWKEKLGAEKLY